MLLFRSPRPRGPGRPIRHRQYRQRTPALHRGKTLEFTREITPKAVGDSPGGEEGQPLRIALGPQEFGLRLGIRFAVRRAWGLPAGERGGGAAGRNARARP